MYKGLTLGLGTIDKCSIVGDVHIRAFTESFRNDWSEWSFLEFFKSNKNSNKNTLKFITLRSCYMNNAAVN